MMKVFLKLGIVKMGFEYWAEIASSFIPSADIHLFVESSPVNVRAKGGIQRIQLEDGKVAMASGSSIACVFITIALVRACNDTKLGIAKALDFLKVLRYFRLARGGLL